MQSGTEPALAGSRHGSESPQGLRWICVFCGASPGAKPEYLQAARDLGRALASRGIGLVYGGGRLGMMGEVAQSVLREGGGVIGIIPRDLAKKEVAFTELSDLRVVESMHERKALMAEIADGFITLPGGLGTIEEFLETLTWAQLGIHRKPCGILNVTHYYSKLISFLDHTVEEHFVEADYRSLLLVDECPEALIEKLKVYQPPEVSKVAWVLRMAAGVER